MISSLVVYAAYNEHQAKVAKQAELAAWQREGRKQSEQAADAVYFAVAEGTRVAGAAHAYAWCAMSTDVAFGPFGAFLSGMTCGALAYEASYATGRLF